MPLGGSCGLPDYNSGGDDISVHPKLLFIPNCSSEALPSPLCVENPNIQRRDLNCIAMTSLQLFRSCKGVLCFVRGDLNSALKRKNPQNKPVLIKCTAASSDTFACVVIYSGCPHTSCEIKIILNRPGTIKVMNKKERSGNGCL